MGVRTEDERDRAAVRAVNVAAFGTALEADLVDTLRATVKPTISLVAEIEGAVVGHIMFSPVSLAEHPQLNIMGLAPMAVAPDRQRQGIGSALVRTGITKCEEHGYDAIVVLGHPEYYPRFGFMPAIRYAIRCEYDAPAEAFMILELKPDVLQGVSGLVRYHKAFGTV
jgi:putative acetyltransferase